MQQERPLSNSRQTPTPLEHSSRYYLSSERKSLPPQKVIHDFFEDHPLLHAEHDKSRLRPVGHQVPREGSARKYIVVEEQVKQGKPITKQELERLISRRHANPQIVTYGTGTTPLKLQTPLKKDEKFTKETLDVKTETSQSFFKCC